MKIPEKRVTFGKLLHEISSVHYNLQTHRMHLNRLSLINFKNITEAQLDFSPQINCFVGDNGTGKTNLLDAIHYLSMCKSAFNITDYQCVKHDYSSFIIEGTYHTIEDKREHILCSCMKGSPKKVCRGGKDYDKLSDHIGLLPIVMITPSDTSLINESGDERRKYINTLLSQLDREYLTTLIKYNQVLAQRNKLLKMQNTPNFDEILEVLNMQLTQHGTIIHSKRKALIEKLAPTVARYYSQISNDHGSVSISYKSDLNNTSLYDALRDSELKDRINMFTSSGVHRDDLMMTIGDYQLRKYGSQGEQKSFVIALKLAQFDIVASEHSYKPILLLDDIFDKLDMQRVEQLIDIISNERFSQIFITDCNKVRLESILHSKECHYTLFNVNNGEVTQQQR